MSEMNSFQDAFYIIAKELGFDYAQPLSPREVFEQQMLPRIRELVATQPAAGEPIHQWADQDLWMDGDEADMASARAEGFKTRTLWTAPTAAAPVADGKAVAEIISNPKGKQLIFLVNGEVELPVGTKLYKAAPPAAAHGDEVVRKLVLPTPEQVMNVVMKFQWEDRKNGTGTTNWAANLGMTVVEYVARLNADSAGGPAVSLTDAEHWTEREVAEFLAIALRHVTVKGSLDPQDIRDAFRVMREQAAMRAQGDGEAKL